MTDKPNIRTIRPFGIIKQALSRWTYNFIPIVAIYCVNVFLGRILYLTKKTIQPSHMTRATVPLHLVFGLELLAFLVVNAFICLFIIHFLSADRTRPLFAQAFKETRQRIAAYLRAYFLLLFFVAAGLGLAAIFLSAGYTYYVARDLQVGKIPVLVAMDTLWVVLVIAVCWYGCLFSLAPLVAAFENQGPVAAMRESRARLRGNVLRYCFIFALFVACYVGLGLLGYFGMKCFAAKRFIFRLIDPAMSALLGPLWLALWSVSYQKLTELRNRR